MFGFCPFSSNLSQVDALVAVADFLLPRRFQWPEYSVGTATVVGPNRITQSEVIPKRAEFGGEGTRGPKSCSLGILLGPQLTWKERILDCSLLGK